MNKQLVVFLLSISLSNVHASAPAEQTPEAQATTPHTQPKTIQGNIFLIPNNMFYVGDTKSHKNSRLKCILDDKQQPIQLNLQDTVVGVWISSKESENWSGHGHPVFDGYCDGDREASKYTAFPDKLPLSMLNEKKEGDFLTLQVKNPTSQKIHVAQLCCKQVGTVYGKAQFQTMLAAIKMQFLKNPNYDLSDEKLLLQHNVLKKIPAGVELEELIEQVRALPANTLECPDWGKYTQACAQKRVLLSAIAQKKADWQKAGNQLTDWGTIPQMFHGPNGYKYATPTPSAAPAAAAASALKLDEMD